VAILSLKRVAIAFILAGVVLYAGSQYWLATRKLVPLDIPVSLSRGHIRTPEFSINLDAVCVIAIEVEGPSGDSLQCLMWGCDEATSILMAQWALSSDGQVEVTGKRDGGDGGPSGKWNPVGRYLGAFRSDGGRHRLDVEVLSDAGTVNAGNPRLRVEACPYARGEIGAMYRDQPIVFGMLVIIGGIMLALARSKQNAEQSADLSIFTAPGAGQQGAGYLRLRRFPRRVLFSGLPSFSLLAASVLLMVGFPLWFNPDTWRYSKGIQVLTSTRALRTSRYDQPSKPLTLRIDKQNRWFFDGKEVFPEKFPAALQQALNRRPDLFVCVDADPGLALLAPVRAMDMIQGYSRKSSSPRRRQWTMVARQLSAAELSLLICFGDPGGLFGLAFRHHALSLRPAVNPGESAGTVVFVG
jgi:hypothetical protein